jgi:hypothetical protein
VSDTARVLFVAAVLSGAAVARLAWRVSRVDAAQPDRLIGELRLARWMAVLLAAVGAVSIGLAIAGASVPASNADAALGAIFVGLSGVVLQREPRESLLLAAAAFVVHALVNVAHRPGWLAPDLAPAWYLTGCATYDVCLAAVCWWGRRR